MNERDFSSHPQNQDAESGFRGIVIPIDVNAKERIMQELHPTPYSVCPGIQRNLGKVRRFFY